jgi:hypothetical protein
MGQFHTYYEWFGEWVHLIQVRWKAAFKDIWWNANGCLFIEIVQKIWVNIRWMGALYVGSVKSHPYADLVKSHFDDKPLCWKASPPFVGVSWTLRFYVEVEWVLRWLFFMSLFGSPSCGLTFWLVLSMITLTALSLSDLVYWSLLPGICAQILMVMDLGPNILEITMTVVNYHTSGQLDKLTICICFSLITTPYLFVLTFLLCLSFVFTIFQCFLIISFCFTNSIVLIQFAYFSVPFNLIDAPDTLC